MKMMVDRVIQGACVLLILSPIVVLLFSHQLISWLAPGDPVPQGAMVTVGLLFVACLIFLLPAGIIGTLLLRRRRRREAFFDTNALSPDEEIEMDDFLSQDKALRYLDPIEQIKKFRQWKENRSQQEA